MELAPFLPQKAKAVLRKRSEGQSGVVFNFATKI